ncbi:hypothetical protein ACFOKF_21885 [Sphingobium rhizovicinum]|uniref:Baseplate protein J-like domain-containing protein n=1 Tax=Sphingobium rhizovicinum TaxID=432308 RepID=A0ABV7NKD3_9SPHN
MSGCGDSIDPQKLVREGMSQDGRRIAVLNPANVPVDPGSVARDIVFARGYTRLLRYFNADGTVDGDWSALFGGDPAVPLAIAAIEDVESYKQAVRSWFDFLDNLANEADEDGLIERFGYVFDSVGGVARGLDALTLSLPETMPLRATLGNMIAAQLAPALARLITYYKAGETLAIIDPADPKPPLRILEQPVGKFGTLLTDGLSDVWSRGAAWSAHVAGIAEDASVYGSGSGVFTRINHCTRHTLFRSVYDQFLKGLARLTADAGPALETALSKWDGHAPHYALFLAFLRLFEHVREAANSLTGRHLDFYYRSILMLKEQPAAPGHAHLLAELARQSDSHRFAPGLGFRAGKDGAGKDAFFANVRDMVANRAQVATLSTFYRHGGELVNGGALDQGRIFAAPVAGPLPPADQPWHSFFRKTYIDGALKDIAMPPAEIGFAVASHYLLMAEGPRRIELIFTVEGYAGQTGAEFREDISCLITTSEAWLEKPAVTFTAFSATSMKLTVDLTGADAPITPYVAGVHGRGFDTDLPMLLVVLRQDRARPYAYSALQTIMATQVAISVTADAVKALALSNDFGPVDPSKPFQPFGASPVAGSSLVIGSKEVFQKKLSTLEVSISWLTSPVVFTGTTVPTVSMSLLNAGTWSDATAPNPAIALTASPLTLSNSVSADLSKPVLDRPDFTLNAPFSISARQGFVRLRLSGDIGQGGYQTALINHIVQQLTTAPPQPPVGPTATSVTLKYTAQATLLLGTVAADAFRNRPARFFHLAPFGAVERHPALDGGSNVPLLPQFAIRQGNASVQSEAEFYIGISGLAPPQSLSLLFQVADGTANPLAVKPARHIDWSYMRGNQWVSLKTSEVQDETAGLVKSGIVALAIPQDAMSDNRLMPAGQHWLRLAVSTKSDAVCALRLVAAQALEVVFADRGNAADFSATPLPQGTVAKLERPDSAVKAISQPFTGFGGRGAEPPDAFRTRVSERLRHKDRSIVLWDYEHLILQAFPLIYKVKCLNHTQYEPNESGTGIYRELAPGHVTIVTIPDLKAQQQINPLKPYTSLGMLEEIAAYLRQRSSCFAQLHVRNPQFEEIRVRFAVRLYDGYDESFYGGLLREAITRFLSPWAFGEAPPPSFGGRVHKSALIGFVEAQPYVDYVADFQLFQDIGTAKGTVDLDQAEASRAVSVLVSAPAAEHRIVILHPDAEAGLAERCGCDA